MLKKGSLGAPRFTAAYYTAPLSIGRDPTRASGSPFQHPASAGAPAVPPAAAVRGKGQGVRGVAGPRGERLDPHHHHRSVNVFVGVRWEMCNSPPRPSGPPHDVCRASRGTPRSMRRGFLGPFQPCSAKMRCRSGYGTDLLFSQRDANQPCVYSGSDYGQQVGTALRD